MLFLFSVLCFPHPFFSFTQPTISQAPFENDHAESFSLLKGKVFCLATVSCCKLKHLETVRSDHIFARITLQESESFSYNLVTAEFIYTVRSDLEPRKWPTDIWCAVTIRCLLLSCDFSLTMIYVTPMKSWVCLIFIYFLAARHLL